MYEDDDNYKDDNLQHRDVNESFINKTKEEESLIKRLMSMNFKQNVIQYVIDIVTSCGKNSRIEKRKEKKSRQR